MSKSDNELRKTTRVEFWRDEAKLDLFSPSARAKFYANLVFGALTTLGFVVFITDLVRNFEKLGEVKTLVGSAVAMIAYPIYSCLALYFKGGDAGVNLMDKLKALRQRADNKLTAKEISSILNSLKIELEELKGRRRPSSGTTDTLPQQQKEFDDDLRAAILERVANANSKIALIDGDHLLDVQRIGSATDYYAIQKAWQNLDSDIELLKKHLYLDVGR